MSEQRKSNWQHPNTYYREREKTQHSGTNECDTSRHPHPFRMLPTKAVQITADPGGNVILEALHFLVEIGNVRHRFVPMAACRKRSLGINNNVARCPLMAQSGHPDALIQRPLSGIKRTFAAAGSRVRNPLTTVRG
jgi:hypothetical protein